ncbi:MAG: GTP cyclohydrolase II [Myxococcota bacterium]|nr:GTP cyclohydrolase II [Myxococcota bacterium]
MNPHPSTTFEFVAESIIPSKHGDLHVRAYRNHQDNTEPVAFFFQNPYGGHNVPVRIHDACFTSEVLGSLKCDCKEQLELALAYISQHGGVIIYLQQEGRGIGLANKIAAYALQETGLDTVEANRALHLPDDLREYHIAAFILKDLDIHSISLMTNNPRKIEKVSKLGITIHKRIPIEVAPQVHNEQYLKAKGRKMGHFLSSINQQNSSKDT